MKISGSLNFIYPYLEFDLILRDGVHYDLDSSGTYTDSEKKSFHMGRLVR